MTKEDMCNGLNRELLVRIEDEEEDTGEVAL
jgi:hypothetical protein